MDREKAKSKVTYLHLLGTNRDESFDTTNNMPLKMLQASHWLKTLPNKAL
jgi:hypothetical protein